MCIVFVEIYPYPPPLSGMASGQGVDPVECGKMQQRLIISIMLPCSKVITIIKVHT